MFQLPDDIEQYIIDEQYNRAAMALQQRLGLTPATARAQVRRWVLENWTCKHAERRELGLPPWTDLDDRHAKQRRPGPGGLGSLGG
jgi:hypothetical protein